MAKRSDISASFAGVAGMRQRNFPGAGGMP